MDKITWKDLENKLDEAVKNLNVKDWKCNNWKKGDIDREYIELYYYKGSSYKAIKCGYWDNVKEEYVPASRGTKCYNVLNKEYV